MDEQIFVAVPCARLRDVAQLVHQTTELRMRNIVTQRELAALDHVEHFLQPPVDGVMALLRPGLDVRHFRLQAPEDEHCVLAALSADLNVCAIHGADDEATVHDEFHVRGAACFCARSGDVLGYVRGWDNGLRCSDAVIWHKTNPQVRRHVRVVVHNFCDVVDELDDILRVDVCRCCLATDERSALLEAGALRRRSLLDHHVPVDQVETVQELPLVLMDTLELAVEKRVHIYLQVHVFLDVRRQPLLRLALCRHPLLLQCGVVLLGAHRFQQLHVREPLVRAQVLCVDVAQRPVCAVDPAPRRHPIGHVHKLVRVARPAEVLVEGRKSILFHDLCVKRRNTIDFVAAQHCDVPHADRLDLARRFVGFLEKAQLLDLRTVAVDSDDFIHEPAVDLPNN
mmetsp:Transcript_63786/g.205543  ORF Transcript_63786/g.205543 Transcript_63786/m.205543 type:complete len:397 (-) Transcript_63786:1407-2597(-)